MPATKFIYSGRNTYFSYFCAIAGSFAWKRVHHLHHSAGPVCPICVQEGTRDEEQDYRGNYLHVQTNFLPVKKYG